MTGDAAPTGSAANNAPRRKLDGRVIDKYVDGADLHFKIGLARVESGHVTREWTGVFLRDGHPIPKTAFRLLRVRLPVAYAKISGHQLPSERVRLYEPDDPDSLE